MAHTYASCHTWIVHVTHINESCLTWISYDTHEWVTSRKWMSHVAHMNESCRTREWVMSHAWMSHVTHKSVILHIKESCHAWMSRVMGWLRLVGSFKLYVSFAKEPYERDYFLQKKPMILRSLLTVATPYHTCECQEQYVHKHVYMKFSVFEIPHSHIQHAELNTF